MGRWRRAVGRGVLFLLLAIAALEAGIRLDQALAPRVPWRAGTARRVLCAGDSYTYGLGVRAEDALPGQLQQLLDAASPSVYSVLNLGVPGMSCAEVRDRLPAQIASLQPDMVIVWCGADPVASESAVAPPRTSPLDGVIGHLRSYQVVRAWRAGPRVEVDAAGLPVGNRVRHDLDGWFDVRWGVQWHDDGLYYPPAEPGVDVAAERRAFKLYNDVTGLAVSKGVRLALLTYPLDLPPFRPANHALRLPSLLTVVDSGRAVDRLPPAERTWTSSAHPGPAMYREIARDVADVVLTRIPPDLHTTHR